MTVESRSPLRRRVAYLVVVLVALFATCRAADQPSTLSRADAPLSVTPATEVTRAPQPVPTTPTPAATPAATPSPCAEYGGRLGAYPGGIDPPEPRGGDLVTLTLPAIPPGAYEVVLFPLIASGVPPTVLGTMDAANGHGAIIFRTPEVPRGCVPITAFDTRDYRGSYPPIDTNLIDYRGPAFAPAPCSALPDDEPRVPSGFRVEVTSNGSGWTYRLIGAHDVPPSAAASAFGSDTVVKQLRG